MFRELAIFHGLLIRKIRLICFSCDDNKAARSKGVYFAFLITEKVRIMFREEKSYAKSMGKVLFKRCLKKTGFQYFVLEKITLRTIFRLESVRFFLRNEQQGTNK